MQVTRWRRYGKDRLYVRDNQGSDIGWWDLTTDEAHPATPDLEPALVEAVAAWRAGDDPSDPALGGDASTHREEHTPVTTCQGSRHGSRPGAQDAGVTRDAQPANRPAAHAAGCAT